MRRAAESLRVGSQHCPSLVSTGTLSPSSHIQDITITSHRALLHAERSSAALDPSQLPSNTLPHVQPCSFLGQLEHFNEPGEKGEKKHQSRSEQEFVLARASGSPAGIRAVPRWCPHHAGSCSAAVALALIYRLDFHGNFLGIKTANPHSFTLSLRDPYRIN